MTESYEELRDQATGDAGAAWKAADREESNLRALYRKLKEDPRYTDEHKAQTAWERYEATKETIGAGKAKAKELLERQARSARRLSLPFPDGEGPITTDTSKLIASQNETARLVRKLERLIATKGPFTPDTADVLRQEYGRGLEVGGVQGGAICRGVLEAADELGIDAEPIVEPHRKERHRASLERAHQSERLSGLIGGRVPEPPFSRPAAGRVQGKASGAVLIPRNRPTQVVGARPPWK